MESNTIIANAIANIDREIQRLTEARSELVTLIGATKVTTTVSKANTDETTAVESLDRETRRAMANAKLDSIVATEKKAKSKSKNGKVSQRDRILAMLAEGHSATVIAHDLGTHVSYVYTVKNTAKREALKAEKTAKRAAAAKKAVATRKRNAKAKKSGTKHFKLV